MASLDPIAQGFLLHVASASTKKSNQLKQLDMFDVSPVVRSIHIGNMPGINKEETWPDGSFREYSYFLLPPQAHPPSPWPVMAINAKEMDFGEFVRFWNQVDDLHKQRRLLVDCLCAARGAVMWIEQDVATIPGVDASTIKRLKSLMCRMVDGYIRELHEYCIDQQRNLDTDGFLYMFQRHFDEIYDKNLVVFYLDKFFPDPWHVGFDGAAELCLPANSERHPLEIVKIVEDISKSMLMAVFTCIVKMYRSWKWSTESGRKRYLKKLRAAAPHWSAGDRRIIFGAMKLAEDGVVNDGTYPEYLIESLGMERFKLLAFGKENFCANCGQSSYTAEDRLWCCRRCVKERARHKARYCDVNCQKSHWIKHKSEMHQAESCANCGLKELDDKPKLRSCARCLKESPRSVARYCDVECQKAHWPEHKLQHSKNQEDPTGSKENEK